MRRKLVVLALATLAGLVALTAALVRGSAPQAAQASSHREAPLIADDPTADNTDLYAFVSPDKTDTVTFIADYIPLEEPAGGPNFNKFGDDVLYEINVDNTGDGKEDISYQFRFTTKTLNPDTFLYNTFTIGAGPGYANLNRVQTYDVFRVENGVTTKLNSSPVPVPPANIGPRSTGNDAYYKSLMSAAVADLGNDVSVFAGPVDDPFFVDLGSIFDLGGLRPFNENHLAFLPNEPGRDEVGGFNTHAIAIQVPISQLTRGHVSIAGPNDPKAVIGVYASASRQKIRILDKDGGVKNRDGWVQVSRLGEPLVNEVIIPLGKKDAWNRSDPAGDAQFLKYYQSPELAKLINILYPGLPDTPETGRDDLVQILLTGVDLPDGNPTGVNNLTFTGNTKADLLRLNMGIAPSAPAGAGNRLGVLAGDLAGFPNGRRLEDDVVDIELRAVADGYGPILNGLFGFPDLTPNDLIGDGVNANDKTLNSTFPYLATPHQGYSHTHNH